MQIKNDVIVFLKRKQKQLMDRYGMLEEIQGEYPEFYSLCQSEMDKIDQRSELIRRKIIELEESD